MAPTPVEGLVQFLLSCIRHSNNGKIDFEAVARECDIVSKGAAAKRYERLLKANDINPSGGSLASTPNNSPEKSTTATATATANTASTTSTPTKKAGAKRKAAGSKPAPKKAKLMKKAAVMCAEDIVTKNQGSGDDDKNDDDANDDDENGDDDDGSLFKGVTI